MPDGILSIGAVFEKAKLEGDFTDASAVIKSATEGWSAAFESSKKATREAALIMQESVRAFAQDVNVNAVKAAEGLRGIAAAQTEVRMASRLMKDSTVDANYGILAMASAQEKLSIASAAAAPAIKALAAETAAGAEAAAVSSNVWVAAYQRIAMGVRASSTAVQQKLVQTAETSKLSAEGMTAGFAGMGGLLGAGMAVGFAAHFLDETAKINVGLGHLAEKTGMSVQSLSGLRQIVKEMGGEFDAVSLGIVRMSKNLADSGEPSKALVNALGGINLTIGELKGLKPEAQLQKIATAFAASGNEGNKAAAAIALFGRGGQVLIPILVEQGAALSANTEKMGKLTGVTNEATASSREWTRNMAEVSAEFQSLGNVVIGNLHYVEAVGAGLGTVLDAVAMSIYAAFKTTGQQIAGLGKEVRDVVTGKWADIGKDWEATNKAMVATTDASVAEIASRWKDTVDLWNKPVLMAGKSDDPDAPPGTGSRSQSGREAGGGADSETHAAADPIAVVSAHIASENAANAAEIRQKDANGWAAYYQGIAKDAAALSAVQRSIDVADAASLKTTIQAQAIQWANYYKGIEKAALGMQKQSQKVRADWEKTFDKMSDDFAKNTSRWIMGQESFARSWTKTLTGMTQAVIENLLKQTMAYIINATSRNAIDERQKLKDAAAAARGAYKAIVGIPYVGPVLAPIAAGAAFAAVEAFEQGGIVGGGGRMSVPILAHAGERVLSQSQTTNFERMVNQSTSTSSSREVHFHDHSNWNGVDGASVEGMYRKHAATGRREMMRQLRLANQI
jgi:hypothetical protein